MAQIELRQSTEVKLSNNQITPLNFNEIDEARIWKNFKKGNEEAFIWIYQEYFPKLFNYGRQFDLSEDFVKDQIQDLFIYIRKNRERLADVNSIKFYLYKSIRRRLLPGTKRRIFTIPLFSLDQKKVHELQVAESQEHNLINDGMEESIKANLSKSLNKLTARQREAVVHFYYEGLTYQEIADIMDLKKVKYARKLIYRAIDALRKDLYGLKSNLFK